MKVYFCLAPIDLEALFGIGSASHLAKSCQTWRSKSGSHGRQSAAEGMADVIAAGDGWLTFAGCWASFTLAAPF